VFFKGSRYEKVKEGRIRDARGREVAYKRIRFIPETPGSLWHTVGQDERLDLIAHRYFQDPELFWRICDANTAMLPDDLVSEQGRAILIPPARR